MQPPIYQRDADFSEQERNNAGGRSTVSTSAVDAELDAVSLSIVALCKNLGLIQRDDGRLRDSSIELYNLSQAARVALQVRWVPRGLWAPSTVYAPGDMVDFSQMTYVCAKAHTSAPTFAPDYAAGNWQTFLSFLSAAGLQFAPTSTITATNVQAAIAEVDAKARLAATPFYANFYGGL